MLPRTLGLLLVSLGLSIGLSASTMNAHSERPVETFRPSASSISLADGIDFRAATDNLSHASTNFYIDDDIAFDLVRPERASVLVSSQAPEAPAPVPEPSSMLLMATALSAVCLVRRWS
jgi:hypothetical protein